MAIFNSEFRDKLKGKRIAILATEGFEEVELVKPQKALEDAGATVDVIAPKSGIKSNQIKAWDMTDWGGKIKADVELSTANSNSYDALHLPGGVMNPDHLRMDPQAVAFVKNFFIQSKPVSAICHAPWMLIEADVVRDKTVTSWPSLQADLRNAGAHWVDKEVVMDKNLVTSRKPDDLREFNKAMIDLFSHAIKHHVAA